MNKIILYNEDINKLEEYAKEKETDIDTNVCPFKDVELVIYRHKKGEKIDTNSAQVINLKYYRKDTYINIYVAIDGKSYGRLRVSNKAELIQNKLTGNVKDAKDLVVFYNVYFFLMDYVANYKPERVLEVKESKVNISNHKNSKKKITNTTYLFSSSFSSRRGGHHASPSYSFSVRGHYRHLKNGKVIWIKEHIKGNSKKKGHEYRI